MSEDVSSTMRVGITVILVAALVATVLNLMVMSNSILSNGQITLQSGIDSVSEQEFATYDNKKVSGTQVQTALSLFQGRDVAVLIQTKSLRTTIGTTASPDTTAYLNYGALLCKNGDATGAVVSKCTNTVVATPTVGDAWQAKSSTTEGAGDFWQTNGVPYYVGVLHNTNGLTDSNYNIIGITSLGNPQYLLSSSRFTSVLLKDSTGSIIGIVFTQVD